MARYISDEKRNNVDITRDKGNTDYRVHVVPEKYKNKGSGENTHWVCNLKRFRHWNWYLNINDKTAFNKILLVVNDTYV